MSRSLRRRAFDPVEIELWKNRFAAVTAEMGVTLRRASYSANIKERRDYSTALFDAAGRMVAQGDDIPVHLGSMPLSVAAALEHTDLGPGDVVVLNDPFLGGTHLPDITVIQAVFAGQRPLFYLANRAHHADVGGMRPGSMPLAVDIQQEGLRIPPLRLVQGGVMDEELLRFILANVRTPHERLGDLRAQIAANERGRQRLEELVAEHGRACVLGFASKLQDYSETAMRRLLRRVPPGRYHAVDWLDDDGVGSDPVRLEVTVHIGHGVARIDFAGTDRQVAGSVNAVEAIARSAVYYVFRTLIDEHVPSNDGCMRPLEIRVPVGSVLAARPPAAVAGGNVETSQRLADVLYGALRGALPERIPAASCGSMNNITIGGLDSRGEPYTYYETLGGGMGARPGASGLSAVHTHMTNSLNTPIEVLHHLYPFRVTRYAIRRGSGGKGRHRGGDGLLREYAFTLPAQVSVLSERRRLAPPGAAGGAPGKRGRNRLWRAGRWYNLPGKFELGVRPGDRLRLETPGGGGWGRAPRR